MTSLKGISSPNENMSSAQENAIEAIVGNIPANYHSADLRNYFSQFIESGGFDCFHFRHRPEIKRPTLATVTTVTESETDLELESSDTSQIQTHNSKVNVIQSDTNQTLTQEGITPHSGNVSELDHQSAQNDDCPSKSQSESHASRSSSDSNLSKKTMCCIVKVKKNRLDELLKMYNRKRWLDRNGESMHSLCVISRIKLPGKDPSLKYKTRKEQRHMTKHHDGEQITSNDVKDLLELRPPKHVMPQGNVGTPTLYFLKKIQSCRLPQKLIGKLGLQFPKHRAKRMYGDVPYDYGGGVVRGGGVEEEEEVKTADGHELQGEGERVVDSKQVEEQGEEEEEEEEEGKQVESEEDADDGEEWERHEALNDDPANAERNKERVFEEEMEVVWEKGGSGIVWYTDAQFWKEKEGDFDEQTTDDLDVDMSVYYEATGGDKDARDFVLLQRDKRRRQGIDEDLNDPTGRIGKFEKHTRGFGRDLMERQGWSDGKGLGPSIAGRADAVDSDGQKPRDKTGFGYRGEKLQRCGIIRPPPKRKPDDHVIISTIYDNPEETDPKEELIRRQEPYHIKHRAGAMKFHKAVYPDEPT